MKQDFMFKVIAIYILSFACLFPKEMIILNSIPKCGTHLASKCIELLTEKKCYNVRWNPAVLPNKFFFTGDDLVGLNQIFSKRSENEFISSHLTYSPVFENEAIKKGYKFIFIYRDPRAQVVSMARWKIKFNANAGMSIDDTIMSLITDSALYKTGWKGVKDISGLYRSFMPWTLNTKFLSIRFEDLVGPKGGGDLKSQYKTVSDIAHFMGVKVDKIKIRAVTEDIFGGTATFNEGQIDGWKKYFTKEHKNAFKKYAGQLLIDLGYEKDFNW